MLLQRLREYASRVELPPQGYQPLGVHWIIPLDGHGEFLGDLVETTTTIGKSKTRIGIIKDHPYRQRAGKKPPPRLITDTIAYVFGKPKNDKTKEVEFSSWKNREFRRLLTDALALTEEPALRAILNFYQNNSTNSLLEPFDKPAISHFA